MNQEKKSDLRNTFWPDITNPIEANKALNSAVNGFYIVCVIQAAGGFFLGGVTAIVEPIIIAGLTFWLKKSRGRWVAILLGLWSLLVVYSTVYNKVLGVKNGAGTNIFLALIIVSVAITAIRTTFFLKKNPSTESGTIDPFL